VTRSERRERMERGSSNEWVEPQRGVVACDFLKEHAKEMADFKILTDICVAAQGTHTADCLIEYDAYRCFEEGARAGDDDDEEFMC